MSRFGAIITPREPSKTTWQVVGLVFAIGFPTILTAVYFVGLAQAPARWQQGVYATGKFLQFAFPHSVVAVGPVPADHWLLAHQVPTRSQSRFRRPGHVGNARAGKLLAGATRLPGCGR